jgi:hypothetical protein
VAAAVAVRMTKASGRLCDNHEFFRRQ